MAIKKGDWVVCLSSGRVPTTWARVTRASHGSVDVEYGEDAPIWGGELWDPTYLLPFLSEEAARHHYEENGISVL